jgi:hypothetical protein
MMMKTAMRANTTHSGMDKARNGRRASWTTMSSSLQSQRGAHAVVNAKTSEWTANDEGALDSAYWKEQINSFNASTKPSLRAMVARLDDEDPLGVDLTLRGASSRGPGAKRPTLYDYALSVKKLHPRKISLIRVGEFYECIGYDAVMLVMHAGLNPMGMSGVPKAGCPLVKRRSIG